MTNPFVRKLDHHTPLSTEHRRDIEAMTAQVQHLRAHETIIRDGDEPHVVNVVLSGWVCRCKILPDGRRQIVSLFLPGDMCDPYVFLLGAMNQTLDTLTPVTLAAVPAESIRAMTASGADLAEALWWQILSSIEIQREWTTSLGRRTAVERLAHFFCEVSARLVSVGLSNGSDCEMPLTQTDLADISGLSTVHVNRSLQSLRASKLIELRGRRLIIHDHQGLVDVAMFDPTYLHRRGGEQTTRRQAFRVAL